MKVIDSGVIYDASAAPAQEKFAFFDYLTKLSDGTLLCAFKVGSAKISPDDKILLKNSTDGGKTWQVIKSGFDTTSFGPSSCHAAGIGPINSAELMISYCCIDRSDPALPFSHPQTTGILPTKVLIAKSPDGGRSWSQFEALDFEAYQAVVPCDRPLRLKNGYIILPFENWRAYNQATGHHTAGLLLSRDAGKTWSRPMVYATDPFAQRYFYDARLTIEPDSGRLVALYWTYAVPGGKDAPIHIAFGSPDGLEWSFPVSTDIEGQIACPLALGDGKLLMFYVHRHDPPSLCVRLSRNFGKTWGKEELVIYESSKGPEAGIRRPRSESEFWDDMSRWSFGHPSVTPLDENTVLLSYYAGDTRQQLSVHWAKIQM